MRSEDVAPDYARVTKPAIVITAEEDALVKRAEAEDAMAAMPHATLLSYPGCGHMPFWEDAGRFNADLGAFAAETFGAAA